MKRAINVIGILLAVASGILAEVSKDTHWAHAGIAIALVTNLRTALVGLCGGGTAVMLLAAALGAGSCAHVNPVVVDCAKEVSPDILPAVESALVADDWATQLAALVPKFGLCVVNKAIAQIMGEAMQDKSFASGDSLAVLKVDHGNAWLAAHPVQ